MAANAHTNQSCDATSEEKINNNAEKDIAVVVQTSSPIKEAVTTTDDDMIQCEADPKSNKRQKQQATGTINIETAKRMEMLALYKEALIRREEACRELERLETEAKASNIPLLEDYAKDPVYLSAMGANNANGEIKKTATPHGLNTEARMLEQFAPPSSIIPGAVAPIGSSSVAQAVQHAAQAVSSHQNPSILQHMQALQDQQQLQQQQYAAQQSLAAQQQLQQYHAVTAGQPIYGSMPGQPGTAQTADPSLLLLAAQYQQNPNPVAPPGAMYLTPGTTFAPISSTHGVANPSSHLLPGVASSHTPQVGGTLNYSISAAATKQASSDKAPTTTANV